MSEINSTDISTYEQEKIKNDAIAEAQNAALKEITIWCVALFFISSIGIYYFLGRSDNFAISISCLVGIVTSSIFYYFRYKHIKEKYLIEVAEKYTCKKCNTKYSWNQVGEERDLISAVPRSSQSVVEGADLPGDGPKRPYQKVTTRTWTEEHWKIKKHYSCVTCGFSETLSFNETKDTNTNSSTVKHYR